MVDIIQQSPEGVKRRRNIGSSITAWVDRTVLNYSLLHRHSLPSGVAGGGVPPLSLSSGV